MYTDEYVADSQKTINRKSCQFPINRTYTNEQNTDLSSKSVMTFKTPGEWYASRSENKCIGLREAKVIPYECSFEMVLGWGNSIDDVNNTPNIIRIDWNITSGDNTSKLLSDMFKDIQDIMRKDNPDAVFDVVYINNTITMRAEEEDGTPLYFRFIGDDESLSRFCSVLNQPPSIIDSVLRVISNEKVFTNVWDRKSLFIHSSISEDYNTILCENGDKYKPKSYLFPVSVNSFDIWFSFDGKNRIQFNDCGTFWLKVAFIYNYKTAAL